MKRITAAAALLVLLSVAGCGESTSNPNTSNGGATALAGASGSSGSGAGQSGGGSDSNAGSTSSSGTGGQTTTALTETEACVAYMKSWCALRTRCDKQDAANGCAETDARCPDLYFSPGSTRTVEGLVSCAEQIATWPCSRWAAGEEPACLTGGTRQAGESCLFSSQCASRYCTASRGDCGVCSAAAAPGGACGASPAAPYGINCLGAQYCENDVCTPDPSILADLGDVCEYAAQCSSNLGCNNGHCEKAPLLGAACTAETRCEAQAYCNTATLHCEALPAAGQPCVRSGSYDVCAPGASCGVDKLCQPSGLALGAVCTYATECADGLLCAGGACKKAVAFHAACDDSVACAVGSTCFAGKCEPRASQGLFEKACQ